MRAVLAYFGCAALVSLVAAEKKNVVIDLSHHDGNVDLEAARGDGIEIVIHKCTQGLSFVDPKYSTNKATANKLGLTWAAYHFADNTNGYEQAEHFVKHAGTVRWYIVDLEENPIGVLPNTVGRAQAETLVRRIEGLTGSYPIVYGSQSFLDDLGDSEELAKCPLWVASYRSVPKMPKNWSSWLMWQYTDGTAGPEPHTVKGIGKVDRSFFNVDYKFLATMKNVVVDLSYLNENVNLEAARDDGITTVVHQCTRGSDFVDPKYSANKAAAEKLGLTWAAYHYADDTDGAAQAEHFIKHAGNAKRYVVYFETNKYGIWSNTVKKAQAEALVEKIKKMTGSYPIVYGSEFFLNGLDSQVLAKCPLWLICWISPPELPKNWSSWLMWQYTDGDYGLHPHTVNGIGRCRRSYLNVDSL